MIVCIAEKPSVARDIAQVLGAKVKKEGYMEGNGYQVTWTFGHLCTLKEPHEYTPQWKAWRLDSLPMMGYGMLGIFIAVAVIILTVVVLGKIFPVKK